MNLRHQSVVAPRDSAYTMLSLLISINLLILQSLQTGTSFLSVFYLYRCLHLWDTSLPPPTPLLNQPSDEALRVNVTLH